MDIMARLVIAGQDALAHLTGLVDGALGEEHHDLAKLLVRATGNQIRYAKMPAQLTLQLLGLYLDATTADGVVLATQNAESAVGTKLGHIVGDECLCTDLWSMDDETALVRQAELDRGEGGIPLGGLRAVQLAQGDMAEGFRHAVGAPHLMGKVLQRCSQRFIDGSTANDELTDLSQPFPFLWHLQRVVDL